MPLETSNIFGYLPKGSRKFPKTGKTRNQFAGFPARGFESHPLRQISVRKGAFSDSGGAGREEKHRPLRYMIEPDLTWKGRERK